jgi:hypothetical protein
MKTVALLPLLATLHSATAATPARWDVPTAGNAYLTETPDGGTVSAAGINRWTDKNAVLSIYFRVDRPAVLDLALRLKVPTGGSTLRATAAGESFEKSITGADAHEVALGSVTLDSAGYVKLDLQGLRKKGDVFAEVESIAISSATAGLEMNYVKDNQDNRFYWGRRGPSVHLPYELPKDETIEYFYNEVTVPEGQDPIGSYYMANGFGEGYFGMQVNGDKERRILFSVWSPFTTDNPKEIPEDHKVKLLAKGKNVHGGEFGGEGSGGQSYFLYPWKTGTTYKFLNRVHPDGNGHSIYTAWFFAPETAKWQLIASFHRPKTDKYLTNAHSFLENFADRNGYLGRGALYGNQWARTIGGKWIEVTRTRFTGDDIASRSYRLDYAGGVAKGQFFLRNGGFFAEPVKLGSQFEREPTGRKPEVDLDALEGNS